MQTDSKYKNINYGPSLDSPPGNNGLQGARRFN